MKRDLGWQERDEDEGITENVRLFQAVTHVSILRPITSKVRLWLYSGRIFITA